MISFEKIIKINKIYLVKIHLFYRISLNLTQNNYDTRLFNAK